MTILIAERKNGATRLSESCDQLMNNFTADSAKLNENDYDSISRDLKVRLQVDSSGNWELKLLTDWGSHLYKTAPLSQ